MNTKNPSLKINKLVPKDLTVYKAIRLKSLKDTPEAFGSTYAREAAFSDDQWAARLSPTASMKSSIMLLALVDDQGVGLVSGVISNESHELANLYQMWVAPEYRGAGIGTALLNSLFEWARLQRVETVSLAVTSDNIAAVSLYESIGFKASGATEPLREGSDIVTKLMEIKLAQM